MSRISPWLGGALCLLAGAIFSAFALAGPSPQAGQFSDYVNLRDQETNAAVNGVNAAVNAVHSPAAQDTGPQWQGEVAAKWRACTADSDCTAAAPDCITWQAVSKKDLPKLAEYLKTCTPAIDPGFQPQTVCVKSICQTTEKTTNISWEESIRNK